MAKPFRRPPGPSEDKVFRSQEAFFQDVYLMLSMVGSVEENVGNITAGAVATFTVEVPGARPDTGMTVQVGVPSNFNTGLIPCGYVSDTDEVTVVLHNTTAGAIDPALATYTVRVMP